ncbi:MAG: sulfatase [Planctomycetes bacterium]|nr:sulfatase [Planctomycetota bacterium]
MIRYLIALGVAVVGLHASPASLAGESKRPPNIIVILADDLGYGDLGCFGNKKIKTPNLDRMARQGMRFTSFYVTEAVCSPSRASLLSGCYAVRVGLEGALNHTSRIGIHERETLLSSLCRRLGYATALFGKWHLGHLPEFNPLNRGFDEYFGIPYPNDCSNKFHPIVRTFPPLPLMEGRKVVAEEPDQAQFTQQFTKRAVDFIAKNKDRPFFLYLAHVMPHVPIHASAKFRGKSAGGLYGDTVEELDWSVGEILAAVQKHGLDENTLIIFTSDNGPFLSYGNHAGSAGPLRGGKLTAFEGGVRMPCIMHWKGRIPAGKDCHEIASTIDLLPTITRLIDGKLPANAIDGKDIRPLMFGAKGAKSPHDALFFYNGPELHAMRSGPWKLHFPHSYLEVAGEPGKDGKPSNFDKLKPEDLKKSGIQGIASRHGYRVEHCGLELYNLDNDIGESRNIAKDHPDVVRRLELLAESMREDLGDALTKRKGRGIREAGMVPVP